MDFTIHFEFIIHEVAIWLWPMAGLRFPFPRNSRAVAKNFTSRFTWDFRGIPAVFPCRGHTCTAKFPSRKSHLIGKNSPFRGNSAEFPAGNRT